MLNVQKIAIIPAYEPPDTFAEYARELSGAVDQLLVVDDGSGEAFVPIFTQIGQLSNATVISYPENRGKGYALKQAYLYCGSHFHRDDVIVTADCDGQHSIQNVIAVCDAAVQNKENYVLGVRDFSSANVPARSRSGNTKMLWLLRVLYGIRITDSQTGLRACSVATAERLARVNGDRFEFETGTLIYAKRNHIPLLEVGIHTIYPEKEEEHVSHFRTFRDSCRVVGTLLRYLLPNMFSGLLATATDLGVFSLLTYAVFPRSTPGYTMIATIAARILSSVVNLHINCRYIFHGEAGKSAGRFYIVWTGQVIASYGNVYLFGHILGGQLTLIKLIGDCVIALLSYQLQCNWVYEEPAQELGLYGKYGRFARWLLRTFSRRYETDIQESKEPVVYVCRHLNMHGPFTTLKWLPFHVHPMIIHMYFDRQETIRHMTQYTFAERYGRKPKKFNLAAHVMGLVAPPLMKSLQAIPVYRDSNSISTMKKGLQYLLKGESLIVYPDIEYTTGYDHPSEIYSGFLMLGDLYRRKTGKSLAFVPLVVEDENRRITAGIPITVSSFKAEGEQAAAYLKNAINIKRNSYDYDFLCDSAADQQPVCRSQTGISR